MTTRDLKTKEELEQKRLAEEIAHEKDFSTVLVNASADGIIGYDLEGRYTLWSPAMEKISGMKRAEVLGRRAMDVFPFMKDVGLNRLYEATFRGESAKSPVSPFVVPETGAGGFFEQQNFPLFDENGKVSGGIGVVRDVTLIKAKYDQLLQQNRELLIRLEELEQELKKAKG